MRSVSLQRNTAKRSSLLLATITILFSVLASAVFAECVLRYLFVMPEPLGIAQPLGYGIASAKFNIKQKEFDVAYRYNRNGFRDKEIPVNSVSDVKQRVLFLGDSMVEGFGVEENDRFSNVSINNINSQTHEEQVIGINVAQMATNPDSYSDNFFRFGVALKPSTVVMGIFVGNDFDGASALAPVVGVPIANERIEIFKYTDCEIQKKWWLSSFYIYALARQSFCKNKILSPKFHGGNIWELMLRQPTNEKTLASMSGVDEKDISKRLLELSELAVSDTLNGQVNPAFLVQSLRMRKVESGRRYTREDVDVTFGYINAVNEVAKANKIKLIVVIIPTVYEIHPNEIKKISHDYWGLDSLPPVVEEIKVLHKQLQEFLQVRQIDYYDPTSDLAQAGRITYHLYDQHLNSAGHRIVANGLTKLLSVH